MFTERTFSFMLKNKSRPRRQLAIASRAEPKCKFPYFFTLYQNNTENFYAKHSPLTSNKFTFKSSTLFPCRVLNPFRITAETSRKSKTNIRAKRQICEKCSGCLLIKSQERDYSAFQLSRLTDLVGLLWPGFQGPQKSCHVELKVCCGSPSSSGVSKKRFLTSELFTATI